MEWMLMPLKRYADFSGRSRRMEFWMWQLFKFAVAIGFLILVMILGGAALMSGANGDPGAMMAAGGVVVILYLLLLLFGLAIIIPDIAVAVRRLHDTNRSGWWILAPIVPYIIMWVSIFGGAASGSQSGMATGGIIGLLAMAAFFGTCIMLLVFYFLEGTKGPNRFGPDPKGANTGEVFA